MAIVKKSAGRIAPFFMGDYDNTTMYRRLDWVYYGGTSYICKKNDTLGICPTNTEKWQKIIELPTELDMIFNEAAVRENIISGDKLSIILGKIKKYFSDLKSVAFSGDYNDLINHPSAEDVGALSLEGGSIGNDDFSFRINGLGLEGTGDQSIENFYKINAEHANFFNLKIDNENSDDRYSMRENELNSIEEINANTSMNNVTGALASKEIITDYNAKINQLNSNLSATSFAEIDVINGGDKYGGYCVIGSTVFINIKCKPSYERIGIYGIPQPQSTETAMIMAINLSNPDAVPALLEWDTSTLHVISGDNYLIIGAYAKD